MRKINISLFALMLVAGATAQAKIYLGAGVGYAKGNANVATTAPSGTPRSTKVKPSASGAILDVHAGSVDHINPDWFVFEQLAFQFDTVKAKKTITIAALNAQQRVDRMYNIAASVGVGYKLASTWNLYGKVGLANAALHFKHRTTTSDDVNFSQTRNIWGGLLGLGVNKIFDGHTVGLDYEYTRYQSPKFAYTDPNTNILFSAKIKNPAYHAVMVKFSKSF
jgi:opacity protein-like surface antigen